MPILISHLKIMQLIKIHLMEITCPEYRSIKHPFQSDIISTGDWMWDFKTSMWVKFTFQMATSQQMIITWSVISLQVLKRLLIALQSHHTLVSTTFSMSYTMTISGSMHLPGDILKLRQQDIFISGCGSGGNREWKVSQ